MPSPPPAPAAAYGISSVRRRSAVSPSEASYEKPLTAAELTSIAIKPPKQPDAGIEETIYPHPEQLVRRLKWLFWIIIFLVLANVILTAYTDPIDDVSLTVAVITAGVQIAVILFIMLAFFAATSATIFVKFGRYDKYFRHFWLFYTVFALQFGFALGVKIYYIVLFAQRTTYLQFFHLNVYYPLWLVQRITLLVFWIVSVYCASQIFDPDGYDPDYLMSILRCLNGVDRPHPPTTTLQKGKELEAPCPAFGPLRMSAGISFFVVRPHHFSA
eukprot:356064-Chlamydomonas_euryale.AAC.3